MKHPNGALVPKVNSQVRLCLDLAWLNKIFIRPIYICLTLTDILLRLAGIKYFTLIDVTSGYHKLKLDEQLTYLATFPCPFGCYRYIQLPFGVAPDGDMFQRKEMSSSRDCQMCLALLMTF